MKQLLRDMAPPFIRRWWRRSFGWRWFAGDYASWAQARAASRGYDSPAIFEKTLSAARAVRDGRAAWERDSVTFAEPEVHWPLLASLLRAAAVERGRLEVLDFGGAFGSAWWQHRAWFDGIVGRWAVVEQAHMVEAGRREFAVAPLQFFPSMDAASAGGQPAVILLSSVLSYLESPHALLADVVDRGFRHVVIDRTLFASGDRDRLAVQRVPPAIYEASYPCWLFSRQGVLRHFAEDYRLVTEWTLPNDFNASAKFIGLLWQRKSS